MCSAGREVERRHHCTAQVDGHDYFVGTDGHAYTLAQLPVQKQG
jgi:hypothetical protein